MGDVVLPGGASGGATLASALVDGDSGGGVVGARAECRGAKLMRELNRDDDERG